MMERQHVAEEMLLISGTLWILVLGGANCNLHVPKVIQDLT